jgi:hypothetical protein
VSDLIGRPSRDETDGVPQVLQGDRVVLRRATVDDVPALAAIVATPASRRTALRREEMMS